MFDNLMNKIKNRLKPNNIAPEADTAEMTAASENWWSMYTSVKSINIVKTAVGYLSGLAISETVVALSGDEGIAKTFQETFAAKLPEIIARTLIGGYAVIKPYVTPSKTLDFDVAYSYNFTPKDFDNSGSVIAGEFLDKIYYDDILYLRVESHVFNADEKTHTVRNRAYKDGDFNREITLDTVPEWQFLEREIVLQTPVNLITTFRAPFSNSVDLNSKLPCGIFANC